MPHEQTAWNTRIRNGCFTITADGVISAVTGAYRGATLRMMMTKPLEDHNQKLPDVPRAGCLMMGF